MTNSLSPFLPLPGVNVTTPSQPGVPPLSSTQLQIDPSLQEFQLVDLSRRFLAQDSFWTLPGQFLGNKVRGKNRGQGRAPSAAAVPHCQPSSQPLGGILALGTSWCTWHLAGPHIVARELFSLLNHLQVDSYSGYLNFKVRYGLARGHSEPVHKPNVVIVGNGQKLIYRVQVPTQPLVVNQREIQFIEVGHWMSSRCVLGAKTSM